LDYLHFFNRCAGVKESGEWRMESGKWKIESRKRRVERFSILYFVLKYSKKYYLLYFIHSNNVIL